MSSHLISPFVFRGQFSSEQNSRQTSHRQTVEKTPKRSRKNTKNSQVDVISEHSGGWVTPKASARKNAGSRNEQSSVSGSGCSGTWHTGQDGRKVSETLFCHKECIVHISNYFSPILFKFSNLTHELLGHHILIC